LSGRDGPRGVPHGRSRVELPKIQLPEFWADTRHDKFTCKAFFESFENILQQYNLNEIELYNLLEKQCLGRAKAMITSLHVINQTYSKAKDILVRAFADEIPQNVSIIKKLTELHFEWGVDDPFLYYAEFTIIIDSFKDLSVDLNTIIVHFI
jgi:hypothetical protein